MRSVDELRREELAEVVVKIHAFAFLDLDQEGEFWNADKPLDADFIQEVRSLVDRHGLRPQTARKDAHSGPFVS